MRTTLRPLLGATRALAHAPSAAPVGPACARAFASSSLRAHQPAPSSSSATAGPSTPKPDPKAAGARTPGPALNVPTTKGGPHEAAAYCASLVQKLDPDAWLCSFFWPRKEKEWWLAIRALNIELHLVTTTVSQPAIAAMRFQFWRDALAAVFATDGRAVPQHPVVIALAEARKNRPIQRYYLSQLIDIRAKTLSNPPASQTLEQHLSTYSPLAGALLQGPLPILVSPTDPGTSHIAHTLSHVAHLLTVTSLLRSMPGLVAKRQLNIPADVAAQHGVVDEDVLRQGAEAKGFRDAAYTIATRGMDELITARTDLKRDNGKVVPAAAMPLFLAAVPAEKYLQKLEKNDFDVFSPEMLKHDWKLAPAIWWRYQSGKL